MSSLSDQIKKAERKAAEAAAEELKKNEIPIPIESVAKLQLSVRPVLDADLFEMVQAGMTSIKHSDIWAKWGFKSQNSVLLFTGAPGTGKTTTARWIAKHLERPLITVAMGDVGGDKPGDTERGLRRIFEEGTKHSAVIFFDECDALLWDRSKAGPDSMWMLGVINCILTYIEKYESIVILSTNFANILDAALIRRVTFQIEFKEPNYETRKKLWIAKWPKWPLAINQKSIEQLAQHALNGAYIEKVIEEAARFAILQGAKPSYQTLGELCRSYVSKDAGKGSREKETSPRN